MSIYGCKHEAWIGTDPDGEPCVCLSNTHDGEYIQYFTEWEELSNLLCELVALHNKLTEVPRLTLLTRYYQDEQERSESDGRN